MDKFQKEEEKRAIAASVEHWEDNVEKASEGLLRCADIYEDACALCDYSKKYIERNLAGLAVSPICDICPLQAAGYCCNEEGSPWLRVLSSMGAKGVVAASKNMLAKLKELN